MVRKMDDSTGKVHHVVADSGAFIGNAPLQGIGEKIYSLPEVVKEIRDKATRQRLQVLPYEIVFRQPSQESIRFVTDFSKKTGDFRSLSAVDIRVLALTYQLEKEKVGTDHIKTVPDKKIEWNSSTRHLEKPTDIAGFYLKPKSKSVSECTDDVSGRGDESHEVQDSEETEQQSSDNTQKNTTYGGCDENSTISEGNKENSTTCEGSSENNTTNDGQKGFLKEGELLSSDVLEDESDDDLEEEEEEDDDDDGWITPSNIKSVKQKMGEMYTEKTEVQVGCLTMDFAMQNVLIQMGLNVISVNGLLIKRAKSFVLRCYACMKITTQISKQFCPVCGNDTLQKVSMTIEDDGTIRYFLSRRKPNTARGKKFSLPAPQGGKHSNNPVLAEDTPLPQQRAAKKSKQKLDIFDPDFIAGNSPFSVNDITSRASQLGIRGNTFNKRNANQGRKKQGRRK